MLEDVRDSTGTVVARVKPMPRDVRRALWIDGPDCDGGWSIMHGAERIASGLSLDAAERRVQTVRIADVVR